MRADDRLNYELLMARANDAMRDAARWGAQPHGEGLAKLRRRDARALRAMAREVLVPAAYRRAMAL